MIGVPDRLRGEPGQLSRARDLFEGFQPAREVGVTRPELECAAELSDRVAMRPGLLRGPRCQDQPGARRRLIPGRQAVGGQGQRRGAAGQASCKLRVELAAAAPGYGLVDRVPHE